MRKTTTKKQTPKNAPSAEAKPTEAAAPPPPATPAPAPKTPRTKRSKGAPKMSGLDAAAKVLAGAGKPMGCADLTKLILSKGMWKTGGKTPAATISAAILREIRDKGKESRFRKAGRGLFAAMKR